MIGDRLWHRRMRWASAENWKAVLNHPGAPLHPRMVRTAKRIIRSRKNPPLIHKGRKP